MRRPSRSSNQSKVLDLISAADKRSSSGYTRFEITTSSPRIFTANSSSGLGGGPETTRPSRSYVPLWQAHQISRRASWYCTVQARCVQTAEKAFHSVSLTRIRMAGLLPNLTTLPEFGLRSCTLPASTSLTETSPILGGSRKRATG